MVFKDSEKSGVFFLEGGGDLFQLSFFCVFEFLMSCFIRVIYRASEITKRLMTHYKKWGIKYIYYYVLFLLSILFHQSFSVIAH